MICEVPEGKKKGGASALLWNLRYVWANQCPMLPAA